MTDEPERPQNRAHILGDPAEPSFVVDLDGRVVALNDLAGGLLGVAPSVAIGSQCWALLRGVEPGGRLVCMQTCPFLKAVRRGDASAPVNLLIPVFHLPARSTSGWLSLVVHHMALRNGLGQPTALLHLLARPKAHGQHEHDEQDEHARELTAVGPTRAHLSQREWQVLRLLANGFTTRQAAKRLGIAYTTARNHAQRILEKLGAPNRAAALTRVFDVPGFRTMDEWLAQQSTLDGDSPDPVADAASPVSLVGAGPVARATQSRSLSSTRRQPSKSGSCSTGR